MQSKHIEDVLTLRPQQILASAAVTFTAIAVASALAATTVTKQCLAPANWHTLGTGVPQPAAAHALLADMALRDVILLGEDHGDADHHRWQLQTLAVLHALRPRMVIGFEAFPRRVQPVLDRWVAGELSAQEFLAQAQWDKVWNFPPELYLPLFEFARVNRIPMLALNVERALTGAVRKQGWDGVPEEQREGLSRPAAADTSYVDLLYEVFGRHAPHGKPARRRDDAAFEYFVEAQTTWDRAFAQALAQPLHGAAAARPLVVGIMGAGHVRYGHGVAHQLRDLGVERIGTLLPVSARADCEELEAKPADAVFALPESAETKAPPPRLGVQLASAGGVVTVSAVEPGSLAAASGIEPNDRIVSVAGAPASSAASVVAAIRRAPPGMWLPLEVRRGDHSVEIIVRFPPDS